VNVCVTYFLWVIVNHQYSDSDVLFNYFNCHVLFAIGYFRYFHSCIFLRVSIRLCELMHMCYRNAAAAEIFVGCFCAIMLHQLLFLSIQ